MWLILLIWGIIAAIMGLAMYGAANSSTHEVQGAIWLLIATVSITGAFVLRAMGSPKKKGE